MNSPPRLCDTCHRSSSSIANRPLPSRRGHGGVELYGASIGEPPLLVCSSCHAPLADGTTHCPGAVPAASPPVQRRAPRPPGAGAVAPPSRGRSRAPWAGTTAFVRLLGQRRLRRGVRGTRRGPAPTARGEGAAGTTSLELRDARALQAGGAGDRPPDHPNTLPIHFVGEAKGLVFYVMPYCEGRTLAELLRTDGALSVAARPGHRGADPRDPAARPRVTAWSIGT